MKAIMWMVVGGAAVYLYLGYSKPAQQPVVWQAPKELVPDHK